MLNDTIKSFIVSKNLSPSRFADEIGVQRSSISHILSGRNKPSLDIVQKIMRRFPELGTDWLLEDIPNSPVGDTLRTEDAYHDPKPVYLPSEEPASAPESKERVANNSSDGKQIIKVLVFYSDGTFAEFSPESKKA